MHAAIRAAVRLRFSTPRNEQSHIAIGTLPIELVAYIIELARPIPNPWEVYTYPLVIASVCRFWREIAIKFVPIIWSTVAISHLYSLKLSSLYIERSRTSLLEIFFYALSPLTPPTLPVPGVVKFRKKYRQFVVAKPLKLLLQHSHRWGSLKLICGKDQFPVIMNSLREARAPNLQDFAVGSNTPCSIPDIFVRCGAPRISSLFLSGICGFVNKTSFSAVTKLELCGIGRCMPPGTFTKFINSFHRLRQLSLVQLDSLYEVALGETITLPELVALELCQGFMELGSVLLRLQAPLLRILKLSANSSVVWDGFWTSLEALGHRLPSVQTLILVNLFTRPIRISHIIFPNIKHFALYRMRDHYPVLAISLTLRHASRWPSLDTLTIYPWDNRIDGEHLINLITRRQAWYHEGLLDKIRLINDTPVLTGVETLEQLGVRLEVLSASIGGPDISNFIGSPSLLPSCRDAYSCLPW